MIVFSWITVYFWKNVRRGKETPACQEKDMDRREQNDHNATSLCLLSRCYWCFCLFCRYPDCFWSCVESAIGSVFLCLCKPEFHKKKLTFWPKEHNLVTIDYQWHSLLSNWNGLWHQCILYNAVLCKFIYGLRSYLCRENSFLLSGTFLLKLAPMILSFDLLGNNNQVKLHNSTFFFIFGTASNLVGSLYQVQVTGAYGLSVHTCYAISQSCGCSVFSA